MWLVVFVVFFFFFFFQAEDGIRDAQESRGLGDVYKRQVAMEVRCPDRGAALCRRPGAQVDHLEAEHPIKRCCRRDPLERHHVDVSQNRKRGMDQRGDAMEMGDDELSSEDEGGSLNLKKLRIQTFSPSLMVAQRRLLSDVQQLVSENAGWRMLQPAVQVSVEMKKEDPFSAYLYVSVLSRDLLLEVHVPPRYPYEPPAVTLVKPPMPEVTAVLPLHDRVLLLRAVHQSLWTCTSSLDQVVREIIEILHPDPRFSAQVSVQV
eukprot:TRINITY_DN12400_c0_g1_i5.p1 TRINITY_DN12400_c0_g1~~TRINITY_DN12400_c0_g1_i5.p1  ORF type:complete len:262 (+),score=72.38 TRINITY_DN12400_c0_g1_i5:70-855(+)